MMPARKERRRQMIAKAAYLRAERRGFQNGDPLADWLLAEREVDAILRNEEDARYLLEERLAWANQRLNAFERRTPHMVGAARAQWEAEIEKLTRLRNELAHLTKCVEASRTWTDDATCEHADRVWEETANLIDHLSARRGPHFRDGEPVSDTHEPPGTGAKVAVGQ